MEFKELLAAFAAKFGIEGLGGADGVAELEVDGIRVEMLEDSQARSLIACAEIGLPPPDANGGPRIAVQSGGARELLMRADAAAVASGTATLEAALDALGDREAAVCIELTKMHERVSRGYLSDLVNEFKDAKVKGEVALVIAGSNPKFARNVDTSKEVK